MANQTVTRTNAHYISAVENAEGRTIRGPATLTTKFFQSQRRRRANAVTTNSAATIPDRRLTPENGWRLSWFTDSRQPRITDTAQDHCRSRSTSGAAPPHAGPRGVACCSYVKPTAHANPRGGSRRLPGGISTSVQSSRHIKGSTVGRREHMTTGCASQRTGCAVPRDVPS